MVIPVNKMLRDYTCKNRAKNSQFISYKQNLNRNTLEGRQRKTGAITNGPETAEYNTQLKLIDDR
jgi:hypothetical protein